MLSGVLMVAVIGILNGVLGNPTDQHLTKETLQTDGLRALVSRLEASLASKDVALQALTSSQSKLVHEFEICSSEQVKLLVGQQTMDFELAKQRARYRQLEAEKQKTDQHRQLLKTDNDELMEKIAQLEYANDRLLEDKLSLENSISSLNDEYLATLQDSEAVHRKLLETIKSSNAVKKHMTEKILTLEKQTENLRKEKETWARKLIQAVMDIYRDVLGNSEPLIASPPEKLPQDLVALLESTQVTEGVHEARDLPKTGEHDQKNIHKDESLKPISLNSIVMNSEGIVNGNERDWNEENNYKRDKVEMERDDSNTVMDAVDTDEDEDAVNLNESENGKGVEKKNNNSNEEVNANKEKCKYENDTREEFSEPQGKENTIVDEHSVGNTEGLDYTDDNSNNQEVYGNETDGKEKDGNKERGKLQVERYGYSTLVDLMLSFVADGRRESKGLENITDNGDEDEVKDNETKGEHGLDEGTELQASEDDDNEFTYLMDSVRSLIDELDEDEKEVKDKETKKIEENDNELIYLRDSQRSFIEELDEEKNDDGNWDEVNAEEEKEYNVNIEDEANDEKEERDDEESKKSFRDEM